MLKRLYLANGYLLLPLVSSSDDIAVDVSIAGALGALNTGDYCYLTITEADKLEIVKIYRDYSGLRVLRAQDGTSRQNFGVAANIRYRLTSTEIEDSVVPVSWNIYADGRGFATVTGSAGTWDIYLPSVKATTFGGIDSSTELNELVVFDRNGMFGCCDGTVTGAPPIPGPYFYLTSMLYPQEAIEIMTPQPKDKNGNTIPPINSNIPWWLLEQPSLTESYVANGVGVGTYGTWLQYGGEKVFTAPPEAYVRPSIGVGVNGTWLQHGGEQAFTAPTEKYISTNCYPLSMLLYGGEVVYNRALDAYINPTIKILDWTLI